LLVWMVATAVWIVMKPIVAWSALASS